MNLNEQNSLNVTANEPTRPDDSPCLKIQDDFSAYLDGNLSGHEMATLSGHLDLCEPCSEEFAAWRDVQRSLGELGHAQPPVRLQSQLRSAIAQERERGSHLSFAGRILLLWQRSVAPIAVQLGGGLAAAIVLVGGISWLFSAPIAVQANDDALAHLVAPRYLYSQVPPQPIETRHDVPIIVEALVDTRGRVYDYTVLDGPQDPAVMVRVEDNLLSSVFKPATVFGVPVKGQVVLTYSGVSVRG
jgi:hypothetical protein